MQEQLENRTFAEIALGDQVSIKRTLSKQDIDLFTALSGSLNPTHLNADFAIARGARDVVGHSMWTGTLFSGVFGTLLPGPGSIYKKQQLQFHLPIHPEDTLTISVEVIAKNSAENSITFNCTGSNQDGAVVVTGEAEILAPSEKITISCPSMPEISVRRHDGYTQLMRAAGALDPVTTAVAHPCEITALQGAIDAALQGLIEPILVGPQDKIRAVADSAGIDIAPYRIIDTPHSHGSADTAVELVSSGAAHMLMKGSLHSDELLGAVLSAKTGLRTGRRISHVFVMNVPTYPGILLVTDAAVNIFPDLATKVDICQNAIELAHSLGLKKPRVAILSAVETITPKIPSTVEAAALCKMAERGQITGGILDGPLAMDNAISPEAARQKGIHSEVAGTADILLAPDLEAANILAKQLTFLANADAAGVVIGAKVPIILTSRADNIRARMASCAVAMLHAYHLRHGTPAL